MTIAATTPLALAVWMVGATAAAASPPAGITQGEAADLAAGRGMGLARPAEAHGHPGPMHVLELADALGLDAGQRAATEALRAQMLEAAQAIGQRVLDEERRLDALFAANHVDEAAVRATVAGIADLRGRLRLVHLATHLRQRAILSADQVARYAALRGVAALPHRRH